MTVPVAMATQTSDSGLASCPVAPVNILSKVNRSEFWFSEFRIRNWFRELSSSYRGELAKEKSNTKVFVFSLILFGFG